MKSRLTAMPHVVRYTINPVRNEADLADTVKLFKAYVAWLNIDLTFQDYDAELKSMPGKYTPPSGELLLARGEDGKAIGCVAVRPLDPRTHSCEMKRLYVAPGGRGLGLGKALVDTIIKVARGMGYQEMMLDTLPHMVEAIALYRKRGFGQVGAYYETPLEGTVFMGRRIGSRETGSAGSA